MNPDSVSDHYRAQWCSRQWRGFIQAIAEEFAQALDEAEQARLMSRVGRRFAQAHALPDCDSLQAFQAAADALWRALDWGQVDFQELADRVLIRHAASPLATALGGQTALNSGFLEGVYREWFEAAGMSARLDVRVSAPESADIAVLTLGRVSGRAN